MKKILSFIICTILCLSILSGCTPKGYIFDQDKENISSIQIVSLKYVYGEDENVVPEEILICEIENISEFLEDFAQIEVDSIHPPYDISAITNGTAIKIVYNNGEYEMIFPHGNDTADVFNGTNVLDEQQFAALIKKYVKGEALKTEYNFLDRESNISSIQIVKVGKYEFSWRIPEQQTVICEIDDVSEFLQKFKGIDCFLNEGTPTKVDSYEKAIKITYEGGYYELIDCDGQTKSYYDEHPYDGFRYFDEQQFENLINEYVGK